MGCDLVTFGENVGSFFFLCSLCSVLWGSQCVCVFFFFFGCGEKCKRVAYSVFFLTHFAILGFIGLILVTEVKPIWCCNNCFSDIQIYLYIVLDAIMLEWVILF